MMNTFAVLIFPAIMVACPPPSPPPPPPPDASDAAVVDAGAPEASADAGASQACIDACHALLVANCGMGRATGCAAYLDQLEHEGRTPNAVTHRPLKCADVLPVRTTADARRIGFECVSGPP
jgi:hypothetical protein